VSAATDNFDYSSATVPLGALFVAADEPLLVFPSVRAAERFIEPVDVENGVYPIAYGPSGEPYRIGFHGNRVVIEPADEPNRPDDLRVLLLIYLQSTGQSFKENAPTSELAQQVWRWESEFWQENDPYGDRFSKPVPGWCCLAMLLVPAALLFALVPKSRDVLIGIVIAALILWPVGVLAKRRADKADFQNR
jgi:hypothetical protein